MLNFRIDGGLLRRRAAVTAPATFPIYPTVLFNETANSGNAQVPVVLISHNSSMNDYVAPLVVVTTREIFLYRAGAWSNITPVYEVGTVNVTSGSSTVNAASGSPSWSTYLIMPGNLVELPKGSGSWYRITGVTTTTLTLATGFSGASRVGASYSIRRTQPDGAPRLKLPVFAEVFNGHLYVAGPYYQSGVWVLKVENIWGFPSPVAATILTASTLMHPGLDVLPDVSSAPVAVGLSVLDDGRVVLGMTDNTYTARIYYSSHLNQAVWSAAPGGYTDVTAVPASLRAIAKLGPNLTLHYDSGIAFGVPTGEDDPPLAYRRTTADAGCLAPRTLSAVEGQQIYLGRDGNVHLFDGAVSRPIGDTVRDELQHFRRSTLSRISHASFDAFRQEFHLWIPQAGDTQAARDDYTDYQNLETLRLTFNLRRRQWIKSKFPFLVGAASNTQDGEPIASGGYFASGARTRGCCFVGLPSYDPAFFAPGSGGGTTSMIYKLDEGSASEISPAFTGSPNMGGVYATTDDSDLGMPGVDKTIVRVTVWFFSQTTESESFQVSISGDGGTTWSTCTTSVSLRANDDIFAHFYFEPATSEKWRFKLACPSGSEASMAACPTRLLVAFAPLCAVEAVR